MSEMIGKDMLNNIALLVALLWMCAAPPSYAYVIGADLTIDNQTDVPMEISVSQPNGQPSIVGAIPAHQTTKIYMENGDRSGWLYQTSVAPFSIKDAAKKTEYVNGRIVYYVGGAFWSKYSFLDSVIAGRDISVDQTYSCANGGGIIFQNKIVVNGNPDEPAAPNPNRGLVRCEGLKASALDDDKYFVRCSDNTEAIFTRYAPDQECRPGDYVWSRPSDGCYWWTGDHKTDIAVDPADLRQYGLEFALDKWVGGAYCKTWEKRL